MKFIYPLFLLLILLSCNNTSTTKGEEEKSEPATEEGAIEMDGTTLRYVAEGVGQPVLVIGSSIYGPRTFSKNLRQHFKMYHVDMRWFAKDYMAPRLEDYDIKAISDDIEAVRKALNLEDFILIGHSIHGIMVMEYAKRYPDHLSHLVMIGAPCVYANEKFEKASVELWEMGSQERKDIQERKWNAVKDTLDELSPKDAMVAAYVARSALYWYDAEYDCSWLWKDVPINMDMTDHIFGATFADYDMFGDGKKVEVPVLSVLGKHDYVVPHILWEDHYDQVPNFTKVVFDKSGHTPQLEEAELFDERLMSWIKK